MGDMADWTIDSMQDAYPSWSPYGSAARKSRPTCEFCGEPDLEWHETRDGWRLFDLDGSRHICNRAAKADDFEDLT